MLRILSRLPLVESPSSRPCVWAVDGRRLTCSVGFFLLSCGLLIAVVSPVPNCTSVIHRCGASLQAPKTCDKTAFERLQPWVVIPPTLTPVGLRPLICPASSAPRTKEYPRRDKSCTQVGRMVRASVYVARSTATNSGRGLQESPGLVVKQAVPSSRPGKLTGPRKDHTICVLT